MTKGLILAMVVLCMAGMVHAEEKFGVPVYPGAKFDADTTKFVTDSFKVEVACYRSGDSLAKIAEFYKKQSGIETMGVEKEGAMFTKKKINITVQNPWMDMKTGKMNKDTLISIGKQ